MQAGNMVALLYEASEGHGGGLTFWLVGFLRFDPVKGVIHKEMWAKEDIYSVSVNCDHIVAELKPCSQWKSKESESEAVINQC